MKTLNKREKTILALTIGVFGFALVFNFMLGPVLSKNDKLNKEINLTRSRLKRYLEFLTQKETLQKKYSKYLSTTSASKEEQSEALGVFAELENLAKKASIKITDIRPKIATGSRAAKEISLDLRLEGSMEAFISLVYNMENSLSLLKIKEFQLGAKPNSTNLEGIFSITQENF